jgi:uncharacterized membrane protein (UPF0127 family)
MAMSSTLAGNFTLIGSVANLIVAQQARRAVEIGFMEYFRVGALITLITIAAGILVLIVQVNRAHGTEDVANATQKHPTTVHVTPSGTGSGQRTYRVVLVCDTIESRARGLQGFRQLRRDEAALFIFERPESVTFWMGSVTFPIDILFVAPDGRVVQGHTHVMPGSRGLYPSRVPVKWAIETAAGSEIKTGDRIRIE